MSDDIKTPEAANDSGDKKFEIPKMRELPADLSYFPDQALPSLMEGLAKACVVYVDSDRIDEARLAARELRRVEQYFIQQRENCGCENCVARRAAEEATGEAQVSSANALDDKKGGIRLATKDGQILH
jgi:hypothetical protein